MAATRRREGGREGGGERGRPWRTTPPNTPCGTIGRRKLLFPTGSGEPGLRPRGAGLQLPPGAGRPGWEGGRGAEPVNSGTERPLRVRWRRPRPERRSSERGARQADARSPLLPSPPLCCGSCRGWGPRSYGEGEARACVPRRRPVAGRGGRRWWHPRARSGAAQVEPAAPVPSAGGGCGCCGRGPLRLFPARRGCGSGLHVGQPELEFLRLRGGPRDRARAACRALRRAQQGKPPLPLPAARAPRPLAAALRPPSLPASRLAEGCQPCPPVSCPLRRIRPRRPAPVEGPAGGGGSAGGAGTAGAAAT